jgi:hypothetical protein
MWAVQWIVAYVCLGWWWWWWWWGGVYIFVAKSGHLENQEEN